MDARTRYWNILFEITSQRHYWQTIYNRVSRKSFWMRLSVAAFTCGAVTALVTSDVAWIRGVASACAIIGQLAQAALPVFGYEDRMGIMQDALSRMAVLSLVMEKDWYRIDVSELGHDEIIRMCVYYDGLLTCTANGLSRCGIAFDQKLSSDSDSAAKSYLDNLTPAEQAEETNADVSL